MHAPQCSQRRRRWPPDHSQCRCGRAKQGETAPSRVGNDDELANTTTPAETKRTMQGMSCRAEKKVASIVDLDVTVNRAPLYGDDRIGWCSSLHHVAIGRIPSLVYAAAMDARAARTSNTRITSTINRVISGRFRPRPPLPPSCTPRPIPPPLSICQAAGARWLQRWVLALYRGGLTIKLYRLWEVYVHYIAITLS